MGKKENLHYYKKAANLYREMEVEFHQSIEEEIDLQYDPRLDEIDTSIIDGLVFFSRVRRSGISRSMNRVREKYGFVIGGIDKQMEAGAIHVFDSKQHLRDNTKYVSLLDGDLAVVTLSEIGHETRNGRVETILPAVFSNAPSNNYVLPEQSLKPAAKTQRRRVVLSERFSR